MDHRTVVSIGLRRATGGMFVLSALGSPLLRRSCPHRSTGPTSFENPAARSCLRSLQAAAAWSGSGSPPPGPMGSSSSRSCSCPVLGRRDDAVVRAATFVGALSVLLSVIGFLRWVFVVPPLAEAYVVGDLTSTAAIDAAWMAQHQFGGALLGEHLGQLLVIGWSVVISVTIWRSRVLPRWLGAAGVAVSALYLLNQGDILATAVPGFPVWDLAGLLGSTAWG